MTTGLHAVNFANKALNTLSGTTFTPTSGSWAALHTSAGEPGAAGTSNASSVTTRMPYAWSAAASGSKSITATLPSWTNWAGTSPETIAYISVWDAVTAGNFLYSYPLTVNKTLTTGDTITLATHTIAITPIAA